MHLLETRCVFLSTFLNNLVHSIFHENAFFPFISFMLLRNQRKFQREKYIYDKYSMMGYLLKIAFFYMHFKEKPK